MDHSSYPVSERSAKSHDLEYVVERAGLKERLKHERNDTPTREEAQDLLNAVRNPNSGVMQCLSQIYLSI